MVAARMGVGIVPREIAEHRIDASAVAMLPLAEPWAIRQLVLGVRDYEALLPLTRTLLDHLRAHQE
jgi:DNA-binding transcriptional LysR family regulator